MNRINQAFKDNKKAFVAYLTAGHKGIDYSIKAADSMINGGVDILEIGIPFSDPIADGPVIQKAMQDALARETSVNDVFKIVRAVREKNNSVPIVLFSYLNPIMKLGKDFYKMATESGADALLIVDMPLEESGKIHLECKKNNLELIFIISPSTPAARIKEISRHAGGFLYYACRKGTTGMKGYLPDDFESKIASIRRYSKLPIAVGFGISSSSMAQEVIRYADAFVVGSYLVSAMEAETAPQELTAIARGLKAGEF